jgi:thiamine-phosphate kinase
MVRGRDWRDDWSTGHDVGVKLVAQNVADVAAMGGVTTGLLVSLMADPELAVAWVEDFARGVGEGARRAGCAVLGGDLSSAPPGVVVVSITALGDLQGRPPVLRSGARVGDLVAVCGSLGWSGAGLSTYAVPPPWMSASPSDEARGGRWPSCGGTTGRHGRLGKPVPARLMREPPPCSISRTVSCVTAAG